MLLLTVSIRVVLFSSRVSGMGVWRRTYVRIQGLRRQKRRERQKSSIGPHLWEHRFAPTRQRVGLVQSRSRGICPISTYVRIIHTPSPLHRSDWTYSEASDCNSYDGKFWRGPLSRKPCQAFAASRPAEFCHVSMISDYPT